MVVAAVSAWHARHGDAWVAVRSVSALVAHVELESYSVLTRMPPGRRAAPADAAAVLRRSFPGPRLALDTQGRHDLVDRLAALGIAGGATYDALIACTAAAHDLELLTLDERALRTYARLGIAVRRL